MIGLPSDSAIHLPVVSSSGSPAKNSARRDDKSYLLSSVGSCFFSTRTAVGALDITVTLYFSTRLHHTPPSGRVGRPSYITVAMPAISGP